MGKHSRTGPPPPGEGPRRAARLDPDDPDALDPYLKRRRPPLDGPRIHRALHGGASHLHPEQPRALLAWDGFAYQPAGTAPDLAAARAWVAELAPGEEEHPQAG
jgi:hypothetical protein